MKNKVDVLIDYLNQSIFQADDIKVGQLTINCIKITSTVPVRDIETREWFLIKRKGDGSFYRINTGVFELKNNEPRGAIDITLCTPSGNGIILPWKQIRRRGGYLSRIKNYILDKESKIQQRKIQIRCGRYPYCQGFRFLNSNKKYECTECNWKQ